MLYSALDGEKEAISAKRGADFSLDKVFKVCYNIGVSRQYDLAHRKGEKI